MLTVTEVKYRCACDSTELFSELTNKNEHLTKTVFLLIIE